MASKEAARVVEVAGREVAVSSPSKVIFPELGLTKSHLVDYWLAVGDGAVRGVARRPMLLKRFVNGIGEAPFYQKRAPKGLPDWLTTATLGYASGVEADELAITDVAGLLYVANLGCLDLNPHPVRIDDLAHPDELRVDLDPMPGVPWSQIRDVALVARDVLRDHGLTGWPKTSGSRGFHILARIERRWTHAEVRRAAVALAREVERRAPDLATSRWWKEERHGVFVDYNQNAFDRTVASAYSVRPTPDARVSAPLTWDEVPACDPADYTVATMPARFARIGDPHAAIDEIAGSLEALLDLARRQEEAGAAEAPWPPHFPKMEGEPKRVAPSRAKKAPSEGGRRKSKFPLRIVAQHPEEGPALEGLERWKARHPAVVAYLELADVLVDKQRGRSTTWTRIRVNLQHVPPELHPPEEPPDPDDDPTRQWREWAKAGGRAR